jgi:hypothetical protein
MTDNKYEYVKSLFVPGNSQNKRLDDFNEFFGLLLNGKMTTEDNMKSSTACKNHPKIFDMVFMMIMTGKGNPIEISKLISGKPDTNVQWILNMVKISANGTLSKNSYK